MSTLDADALATLTPEEREAIESDEYSPAERAALEKIASDPDAPDATDDDDDEEGEDADSSAEAAPEPAQAPAAPEPAAAIEPPPAPRPEPVAARYDAPLPNDYDVQITALKTKAEELRRQFKEGEIDIDERDDELAALAEEREKLLVQRTKSEIAQEMAAQAANAEWAKTVQAFVAKAREQDGLDYQADLSKVADFDQFFAALKGNQAHAGKPEQWYMDEAHKRVLALHGITPRSVPAAESVAEAKARRKPPIDNAPKTLAQVPGADGPGDVNGEFADLDSLDGEALEDAIGKMARTNPAALARYMKGR